MPYENLELKTEGAVAIVTISRPDAMNALNQSVLKSLAQVLDHVESDKNLRALILTGAGEKAFVAGADIKQFTEMSVEIAQRFAKDGQNLFTRLEQQRVPVIAAVNGFALGGGLELALACDFIFASENAKFGLPECTLGIMPGFGGTVRLPRRIGVARARELTYTGMMISASDALTIGLVNKVVPQSELLAAALQSANQIASRAPIAVGHIKRSLHEGASLSEVKANELEASLFSALFQTQDRTEGVKAFIEKRKPAFQGN